MPYADVNAKRARDAAYHREHRTARRQQRAANYQANREAIDARNKAYLAERPTLRRAIAFANLSNRRARRRGIDGRLLGREVILVLGPCAYCAGEAEGWDHVIPLSRGGLNAIANIVRCCTSCNRRKGRRLPSEWTA